MPRSITCPAAEETHPVLSPNKLDIESKHCAKCDTTKPKTEFAKNRARLDGVTVYCRLCERERQKKYTTSEARRTATRRNHAKRRKENPRWAQRRDRRNYEAKKRVPGFRQRANESRDRHEARKRGVYVEDVDRQKVFERDEGICGICRQAVTGVFHIDHVVALANGGEHSYANVQLSHPHCNMSKGAR